MNKKVGKTELYIGLDRLNHKIKKDLRIIRSPLKVFIGVLLLYVSYGLAGSVAFLTRLLGFIGVISGIVNI